MKLEKIKQNCYAIQFIKNPTEEMKLVAVKQYGGLLNCIENPTDEMKLITHSIHKEASYREVRHLIKEKRLKLEENIFKTNEIVFKNK